MPPHNPGASELRRRTRLAAHRAFRPRSRLTGSEWTERYYRIDRVGRWRWETAPYMRAIQDSFCDPSVPRVALMKGSQIAGTTGGLIPALGYAVHQRPTRILLYFPSESDAKKFSKDKLPSGFSHTPVLRDAFESGEDNLFEKSFSGGKLYIHSGATPRTFRQIDAEWVFFDDLDGFDLEVGDEGDAWSLGEGRTRSYRRGKRGAISTPTLKHFSQIEDLYDESDRRRFHVPCPHCKTRQVLRWGDRNTPYGFKWDTEERDGKSVPVLDSIAYMCEACGALIEERHKAWMVRTAAEKYENHGWIAEKPGRSAEWGHGYHLPQFISLFPGASWRRILETWYEAKGDDEKLKTVVNQVFAETWEEKGQRVSVNDLQGRAEVYVGRDGQLVDVPDGVGVLVAGVDVQHDRLEPLVKGYGIEWESWDIFHERIWGDPQKPGTWDMLRALLARRFEHASGYQMPISATMIDAADGGTSAVVDAFVRPLEGWNVWSGHGDSANPRGELLKRSTRKNKAGVKRWTIGTFKSRTDLASRLRIVEPGPRYVHVRKPDPSRAGNGFDDEYFKQFAAWKLVRRNRRPLWIQIRDRDEAHDLQRLCDSAFRGLGTAVQDRMPELVEVARRGGPGPSTKRGRRVLSKGVEV